jgi:hypothetical protein
MQMMGVLLLKHPNILVLHVVGYLVIQMRMSKFFFKKKKLIFYLPSLFLFSYFSLIAKQLSHRIEEYKRTVWEIERTAESWTKNKAQSPQDIARIMHDQNQTFLALANRVASLHECVEREKEFYKQYFKAYS